jgi:hypothetical protein
MPIDVPYGSETTWSAQLDLAALKARVTAARTAQFGKGPVLEDLAVWLLAHIPGFSVLQTNTWSFGRASEIDATIFNWQHDAGMRAMKPPILVECKNWEDPVDSAAVAWFDWKLRLAKCEYGFLITANGITGNPAERSAAYQIVALARGDRRTILVFTLEELENLTRTDDLRHLIALKICTVAGAALQQAQGQNN